MDKLPETTKETTKKKLFPCIVIYIILFSIMIGSISFVYFYGSNIKWSFLKNEECYNIYHNISIHNTSYNTSYNTSFIDDPNCIQQVCNKCYYYCAYVHNEYSLSIYIDGLRNYFEQDLNYTQIDGIWRSIINTPSNLDYSGNITLEWIPSEWTSSDHTKICDYRPQYITARQWTSCLQCEEYTWNNMCYAAYVSLFTTNTNDSNLLVNQYINCLNYKNDNRHAAYNCNNNHNEISYYLDTYMVSIDIDTIVAKIDSVLLKKCDIDDPNCKLDMPSYENTTKQCLQPNKYDSTDSSMSYTDMLYMAGSIVSCIGGLFSVLLYFNNRQR